MREEELRNIARRAVGRALADRGRLASAGSSTGQLGAGPPARLTGVLASPSAAAAPRPGSSAPARPKSQPGHLVTVECLAPVPDGGAFDVPFGARITPLAREEAWRRRIELEPALGSDESPAASSTRMRIAVASDHGGFPMKQAVVEWVRELGHEPLDLGPADENPIDYPDQAFAVADAVRSGRAKLGIVVDGAGIGSAMAANKVPGIRAALCYDRATASNAREHNYANVLSLGGRMLAPATAREVVATFLATPTGAARHGRRVDKISAIEQRYSRGAAHAPDSN